MQKELYIISIGVSMGEVQVDKVSDVIGNLCVGLSTGHMFVEAESELDALEQLAKSIVKNTQQIKRAMLEAQVNSNSN